MIPTNATSPVRLKPIAKGRAWGGTTFSHWKKFAAPATGELAIGESWEVSTDLQFPSFVTLQSKSKVTLNELLNQDAKRILGASIEKKYGPHSPLLLKWLNACDLLSVQLHPKNGNSLLKENECGKPESWLVLDVEKNGFVYFCRINNFNFCINE